MKQALKALAMALLLSAGVSSCTEPDGEDLHDDDLKLETKWDDLMSQAPADEPVDAAPLAETATAAERLSRLPDTVKRRPKLAYLAVRGYLNEPTAYAGGVYGTLGTSRVYVAPKEALKEDYKLYWVMVKVLSEKYSCFMIRKQNVGTRVHATCRDGRQVVFWKSRGPDWVGFRARQYDGDGYEIQVRHHRIVRISQERAPTFGL